MGSRIDGLKQFIFGADSAAHKGASYTRDTLRGWRFPWGGSPDEQTTRDLKTLRARATDLRRNDPLAQGVEHTKATGVVGTGLALQAAVNRDFLGLTEQAADDWEGRAEMLFNLWAADPGHCHVKRTQNFWEQQDSAFRAVLRKGDHWVQLTTRPAAHGERLFQLALQHIAAERVSNPDGLGDTETLVQGVEKDPWGSPIRVHVSTRYPGYYRVGEVQAWSPLPIYHPDTGRRVVLHLARVLDDDETRPAPDLSPVIEQIKQLGRYTDAEINAAVVNAFQSLVVKSQTGQGLAGLPYREWAPNRKAYYEDRPIAMKEGQANILALFPDDDVTSFNPNRPNTAFEPFLMAAWSMIGTGLELPHELLVKRFQASYSAARAALLVAWSFFASRRAWLAARFCQPVYEAFIDEQVAFGRLAAPGYFSDPLVRAAYLGAEWVGDAQGQIDESKAVAAAKERIALGISTRKRECMLLTGQDYDQVRRQLDKEARQGAPAVESASAVQTAPQDGQQDQQDQQDDTGDTEHA